ncbi:transposase [Desulfonema magnum]|uniref:Transposase domain-containing protein n=1 Tax=Desulfonema magnum TaxID=45655 RepID=A0A975GR46_9BACT|nr:transposase [Desulfonema magnum]QTA89653.1 Transposase domain-containing protein [Desulfonema magnum]
MIRDKFEEAFSPEWVERNITYPAHELVVLRKIIPWEKIVGRLAGFYDKNRGAEGKSLRIMVALLIVSRLRGLSDRELVREVMENRYIQYFCNVADEGLRTFLHPSSLCVFRRRVGEEGIAAVEEEVFGTLRRAGVIRGDDALTDSTVLESDIIYPNDVQLIHKAFRKMRAFAKMHGIPLWWDDRELRRLWREFGLDKKGSREKWLTVFNGMFVPALKIFQEKVGSLRTSGRRKKKAVRMLGILNLLEEQTLLKLAGERHINDRIVSLDDPDARPIKKGKSHPECEFGTKVQMTFDRDGFLITVENFIGNPSDKILYGDTLDLFINRMKKYPDTVVTDLGYRSLKNLQNTPSEIGHVFMGRSDDVAEDKQDFCCGARSATEGFIAVAKNLRGFGRSLWHGLKGHRIWSLLCQTASNLKKFLQLWFADKIEEESMTKLGLA